MAKQSSRPVFVKSLSAIYRAGKRLRWYLAEKRLKQQRPAFYKSLDLYPRIHFTHTVSPFLKTVEFDAAIYAYTGEAEKLKQCLARGASPNLRGLMENAIFAEHLDVVQILLDHGANPNRTVDLMRNTLLHEATMRGHPKIVELFLARGADPNRETRDGKKPLYYAYDRATNGGPLARLLEPVTKMDPLKYRVDEFLNLPDPQKAYWALFRAIQEGFRQRSPAELRVLSLADFTGNCLTNGFETFDGNARWAVVPAAELMEAIGEAELARGLWEGIAIMREFGQKVGRDPFDRYADYVELDKATENKLCELKFRFTDYVELLNDERLYRKTMDYVRRNRELFT